MNKAKFQRYNKNIKKKLVFRHNNNINNTIEYIKFNRLIMLFKE